MKKHVDFEVPAFGELTQAPRAQSSYEASVLQLTPRAYWRSLEPAGDYLTDVTGNGHDGTPGPFSGGTASLLHRNADPALSFDGSTDATIALDEPLLEDAEAWTLLVWFARLGLPTQQECLLCAGSSDPNVAAIWFHNSLEQVVGVFGGIGPRARLDWSDCFDGLPHLVALRYAAGQATLWLDGATDTDLLEPNPLGPGGYVGRYGSANARPVQGTLDEPAMFDDAITDAQLNHLWQQGRGDFMLP